jgi:hypothetical protein
MSCGPIPRRALFRMSAAATLGAVASPLAGSPTEPAAEELPPSLAALQPMTEGVAPIGLDERKARLARAQERLRETGLDALVMASGSSLEYFTGAVWGLSERFFGAVVTREGEPAWVSPAFEKERALEQIKHGTDVRVWEEDGSPADLVIGILRDRNAATGRVGIDEAMPFAFADAIAKAAPAARLESGTPVTAGCRVVKDAHEIAIMRRVCEITVQAHRAVFAALREGMTQENVQALSVQAHRKLGVKGGALVLFGPDAAFPHGTARPQPLKPGDVVLVDGGGTSSAIRATSRARSSSGSHPPTGSGGSGTSCARPRRRRSAPRVRARSARPWTRRRARSSRTPASGPTTGISPTGSATASASTGTSTRTWSAATPRACGRACASPTSRASTCTASSACATRTCCSSPRTGRRT